MKNVLLLTLIFFLSFSISCVNQDSSNFNNIDNTNDSSNIVIKDGVNLIGNYDVTEDTYTIFVESNYIYLGTTENIYIFDINNKTNPVLLSKFNDEYVMGINKKDNYLFLNTSNYFRVYDITDKGNPSLLNSLALKSFLWYGLEISGNYAYIATGANGIAIIDISNPSSPSKKAEIPVGNYSYDVDVIGNNILVADENAGFVIYDITNLKSPVELYNYNTVTSTKTKCRDIFIDGNYAYVSANYDGFFIFDISDIANPIKLGTYKTGWWIDNSVVNNNFAFTSYSNSGLIIVDITDKSNPVYHSKISGISPKKLFFKDNFLYVARYKGFSIYSVKL